MGAKEEKGKAMKRKYTTSYAPLRSDSQLGKDAVCCKRRRTLLRSQASKLGLRKTADLAVCGTESRVHGDLVLRIEVAESAVDIEKALKPTVMPGTGPVDEA
jgi:hypothetical protein